VASWRLPTRLVEPPWRGRGWMKESYPCTGARSSLATDQPRDGMKILVRSAIGASSRYTGGRRPRDNPRDGCRGPVGPVPLCRPDCPLFGAGDGFLPFAVLTCSLSWRNLPPVTVSGYGFGWQRPRASPSTWRRPQVCGTGRELRSGRGADWAAGGRAGLSTTKTEVGNEARRG